MKAESARRAGEARNLADVAVAGEAMERDASSGNRKVVAGRAFEARNGVWTDANANGKTEVVNIEPFSKAYFAVLRALPELKPVWSALPSSVTAGKRVAVGLKSGGKKEMSQLEINNLVAKFRS
jgi:hypothetical protein